MTFLRIVCLCALILATGCAGAPQTRALSETATIAGSPVELDEVPFHPQEAYQCGPAALATVLNWSGAETSPQALVPQVYLPQRKGSLQLELVAATRRAGRVPYVLEPRLEDLLREVAAGHPVLVLQNLALDVYPVWHYAVVVGFDLQRELIVLRSGTTKRLVAPLARFERTWARADHWALVALPPGRLPATAREGAYLQAAAALERLQRWDDAERAYVAALARWPDSVTAQLGLGNARYGSGDRAGAELAFRAAAARDPQAASAYNNLAQVLLEQGRLDEADSAAQIAVGIGGPLLEVFRRTLGEVRAAVEASKREGR